MLTALLLIAWLLIAVVLALAICRAIKIGDARDRAAARRATTEKPSRRDAA